MAAPASPPAAAPETRPTEQEAEDLGKTCEEEMISLAEEKEMEEKEDKLREEKEKEGKEEEEQEREEQAEEEPSTAGEKRLREGGPGAPPAKKRCLEEGQTSSVPCEVSSTSLHSSNGSSTSTKPVATEETEASSETDLLKLAEKAAEAAEKEAVKKNAESDKTLDAIEPEAKEAIAEAAAAEEEEEDMAAKLLGSGISVSLIKKKIPSAASDTAASTGASGKEKPVGEEGSGLASPLDIGPNISVTMIQKEKAVAERRAGLTVKSPGELLETPRAKVPAQLDDLKDSISVSRVHRSPATTPRPPQLAPGAPPPHIMFPQFPPGAGLPMGPPGPGPLGMPGLHPRPGAAPRPPAPLHSGPVSEQLAAAAGGLADYMRMGLEDLLREMSAQGSPQATIKGLQLELEKMAWRHQQELADMKQNVDTMMREMKGTLEKENQRTVEQFRKAAEAERMKAISDTKKKQWCANCTKEAIFYCCWNTSYCDYPCQQAHWPHHLTTCSQANQEEDGAATNGPPSTPATGPPPPAPAPERPPPRSSPQMIAAEQLASLGMPRGQVMGLPAGMGFSMAGMPGMGGMRPQFGMPRPAMGLSIRPGVPGQLTLSRPYFM